MGRKESTLVDGYEDLTQGNFITVEEEPHINVKFTSIDHEMKTNQIVKDIKSGDCILFIDLKELLEDPGTLRIFINKIRRISDENSITMKIYGKNWLLILPKSVTFHVGDE